MSMATYSSRRGSTRATFGMLSKSRPVTAAAYSSAPSKRNWSAEDREKIEQLEQLKVKLVEKDGQSYTVTRANPLSNIILQIFIVPCPCGKIISGHFDKLKKWILLKSTVAPSKQLSAFEGATPEQLLAAYGAYGIAPPMHLVMLVNEIRPVVEERRAASTKR